MDPESERVSRRSASREPLHARATDHVVPDASCTSRVMVKPCRDADGSAADRSTVGPAPAGSPALRAREVWERDGGRGVVQYYLRRLPRPIRLGPANRAERRTDAQTTALSLVGFVGALTCLLGADGAAPWTVISCDLNNFHLVNEFLGLRCGTALLRVVASRLLDAVPEDALVARAYADHFLVAVPPRHDPQSASAIVARLDALLRQPVEIGGEAVHPSATFGSAVHGGAAGDADAAAEALILAADHDLRLNKDRRDGRQHVTGSLEALRLDGEMYAALAEDRIAAHFQPLYDLATGELSGLEALARWTTTDGRIVPPSVFIPIAEGNGLIHALGDQILSEVERVLVRFAASPQVVVHVNVSAVQLSPGYAARFLQRFSHDASILRRISVEVTESKQIVDHDAVDVELHQLHAAGIAIALDDFGTGYSSLSRLSTMPATQIKIDKTFVQQAVEGGTAVLEAMIILARAFDLRVVAEGVETFEQLRMVERLGCDLVQGYLFSPAVAPGLLPLLPRTIASMLTPDARGVS